MAVTLALVEATALFAAVSVVILLWAHHILMVGSEISTVAGEALAISSCCVVSFYYNDLYDLRRVRTFGEFAPKLPRSLAGSFALLAVSSALLPIAEGGVTLLVALIVVTVVLVVPLRAVCYEVLQRRRFSRRVLLLGTGPLACKIADEMQAAPWLGYTVVGFIDDTDSGVGPCPGSRPRPPYPVITRLQFTEEAIEDLHPDYIVVALTERRQRLPMWGLLSSCMNGRRVEDGIEFYERLTEKLAIESMGPSFLVFSKTFVKARRQLALRRLVSVVVSLVGLILTAPLMALTAILIKLDSPGGALFVQDRVGLGGRVFRLIKFRTMRQGPPGERQSTWERDEISRITPTGRWLRKLRLDELPQFVNMLLGHMDLIGPRPEMASNVQTMTEQIPYYAIRHMVRPGITGWAQVRYGYAVSREEVAEKTRYDLYYIKHMSLGLDLRILAETVKIVLFGRGAQ